MVENCALTIGVQIVVKSKIHGTFGNVSLKKNKAVPLHAMEAHGGRGGIAPTHT
jgi:hypothetical protein